jgi:hypothetical protein
MNNPLCTSTIWSIAQPYRLILCIQLKQRVCVYLDVPFKINRSSIVNAWTFAGLPNPVVLSSQLRILFRLLCMFQVSVCPTDSCVNW